MALRTLPMMPDVILNTKTYGSELGSDSISDERASEIEVLSILKEMSKAKDLASSGKKDKKAKQSKETAYSHFKKSAKDLLNKTKTKRIKVISKLQKNIADARSDSARTIAKLEILTKTIESKLKGHQDMKRLLENNIEAAVKEMQKKMYVKNDSIEMIQEYKNVQDAIKTKLVSLQAFLSNVEKEMYESNKIARMMQQVQYSRRN